MAEMTLLLYVGLMLVRTLVASMEGNNFWSIEAPGI